jgi:hypothetical protein
VCLEHQPPHGPASLVAAFAKGEGKTEGAVADGCYLPRLGLPAVLPPRDHKLNPTPAMHRQSAQPPPPATREIGKGRGTAICFSRLGWMRANVTLPGVS